MKCSATAMIDSVCARLQCGAHASSAAGVAAASEHRPCLPLSNSMLLYHRKAVFHIATKSHTSPIIIGNKI